MKIKRSRIEARPSPPEVERWYAEPGVQWQ
jgi:hypothetical protein